jgi:hypothetical protein
MLRRTVFACLSVATLGATACGETEAPHLASSASTGSSSGGGTASSTSASSGSAASTTASSGSGGAAVGSDGIAFTLDGASKARLFGVAVTASGDLVVAGQRGDSSWAARVSTRGALIWELESPPTVPSANAYQHVAVADDGTVVLAGQYVDPGIGSSEASITRVSAAGSVLWSRTLSFGISASRFGSILVDGDSVLVPADRFGLVRFDLDGDVLSWVAPDVNESNAAVVARTSDGGLLLAGGIKGPLGSEYVLFPWIGRFDAQGEVVWEKRFPELQGSVHALRTLSDGGIVIGGAVVEGDPNDGTGVGMGFVTRMTPDGAVLWSRSLSSTEGAVPVYGAAVTDADEIVVTGSISPPFSPSTAFLLRFSSEGALVRATTFGLGGSRYAGYGITLLEDRPVVVGDAADSGLVLLADENDAVGGCGALQLNGIAIAIEERTPAVESSPILFTDAGQPVAVDAPALVAGVPSASSPLCVGDP